VLVVEGEERELQRWDLFHCPPRTPHTIVATRDEPALTLAVGARKERGSVRYPADAAAIHRGAGVEKETASPREAYAGFSEPSRGPAREIFF
jgi:hypothetical protein